MRFTMFALLYFAQGSILGYFTALNALYLLSHGLSMSLAGLFSAIALIPLILKIFLGILSDKVNFFGLGHRKPYIIMGLLLQASMQIVFPFIHPAESFGWLVFVAFISLTCRSVVGSDQLDMGIHGPGGDDAAAPALCGGFPDSPSSS